MTEEKKSSRGGARAGAGRKTGTRLTDEPREVPKGQRYTRKESDAIARAAAGTGYTESEFIRNAALTVAKTLGHEPKGA